MPPKVTVLVASYNNARFLPACLESVLSQTYSDFEVLVVDDCSTDDSQKIAEHYSRADGRVKLITTDKNRGVTYTKHLGLQRATGEYVAVLDSDDMARPHRLAKQVAWLDSHPETVLVAGDYGVIDAAGRIIKRQKRVPHDDVSIRWWLTFGNCLIHSTVMYRRQPAIEDDSYDPSYFHGEDLDLYTKLLRVGKFAALPEVVSLWRSHRASVTKYVPSEERDRYYIELVQRSIQWQTGQDVDFDTAAAVFYNTKRPARSDIAFRAGIHTLITAFDYFHESAPRSQSHQNALARCFIKHLVRLRKRNKKQTWWHDGRDDWVRGLRFLIVDAGYRWYRDSKLWLNLPLPELFQLIKIGLAARFYRRRK